MIYLKNGIGEILTELTICLGLLTNISLNIVEVVGLKPLPPLWLIELISKEEMPGLKLLWLYKLLLTVKLEEVVTEVTL